jgi:hypothetical protein
MTPLVLMLELLVLVVLHPMNHHPIQLVVMPQDTVLVLLALVLVVLVHMNHHLTIHQLVQLSVVVVLILHFLLLTLTVMVFYLKVNSDLLDIRVRQLL